MATSRLKWSYLVFALCCVPDAASAWSTNYYYDAQGHLLAATSPSGQQRTSRTDIADNPSYLHVFPTAGPTSSSVLPGNGALVADQALVSQDGRFTFSIQEDGYAVVHYGSQVLWNTNTNGFQPGYFLLGGDGNLHFYGPDDSLLWQTTLSGGQAANSQLVMQSDGNLVLLWGGSVVWSTGTGGH